MLFLRFFLLFRGNKRLYGAGRKRKKNEKHGVGKQGIVLSE